MISKLSQCRLPPLECLVLGFLLLAGCGDGLPKRFPVSGRVLIDGKPLEADFVQVYQQGHRAASGKIGPDGRFTLTTFEDGDGCVLGKHRAVVYPQKELNATTVKWLAPKKYTISTTSDLEIDVTGSRDDVELHLTWNGSGHDKPFIETREGD